MSTTEIETPGGPMGDTPGTGRWNLAMAHRDRAETCREQARVAAGAPGLFKPSYVEDQAAQTYLADQQGQQWMEAALESAARA